VVRALADSAARHATDLFALPAVAPCAERLITLPNAGDGPPRTEAAKWLRDEANTSNGETASRLRALADKVH
ncbi:MAG: hypothetical protein HY275_02320, partial [Gemmatimonadetes bacterium]|nr:hypothetical protein [Gemmatimonadota bacterium]